MRYSRFDPGAAVYEVFEDDKRHPINADLPVPTFSGPDTNGIGVPAQMAGRPLPSTARRIGTSWHPVGVLVSGGRAGALGAAQDVLDRYTKKDVVIAAGATIGVYGLSALMRWDCPMTKGLFAGAVALVALGAAK